MTIRRSDSVLWSPSTVLCYFGLLSIGDARTVVSKGRFDADHTAGLGPAALQVAMPI